MSKKHRHRQGGSNLPVAQAAPPQPANPAATQRVVQAVRQSLEFTSFSGPLPPPEQLEHYERIAPGIANRIVVMAEEQVSMAKSQMEHRHDLERTVIHSNTGLAGRGQWFAFILGMTGLVGAMLLIHEGRELGGATAFVASLASLVAVFVYGRKQQEKELAAKREQLQAGLPVPTPSRQK